MTTISETEALKIIPELFEINLNVEKDGNVIFRKLSKVVSFDEAFIYFVNLFFTVKTGFKSHFFYELF